MPSAFSRNHFSHLTTTGRTPLLQYPQPFAGDEFLFGDHWHGPIDAPVFCLTGSTREFIRDTGDRAIINGIVILDGRLN